MESEEGRICATNIMQSSIVSDYWSDPSGISTQQDTRAGKMSALKERRNQRRQVKEYHNPDSGNTPRWAITLLCNYTGIAKGALEYRI